VGDPYSIVLASRAHLKAIPTIERAALALFAEDDIPLSIRFLVTDRDVLESARREERLWIALDGGGRPVGFALLEFIDGLPHLDEMDVDPTHGRRGIGSRLLAAVIDRARRGGHAAMTLVTFGHLPWNAPFYENFGFRVIEREHLTPGLRDLLREEALAGLDTRKRVAMRLDLA
jgi:GNAT superfamily N-acetyltransferase